MIIKINLVNIYLINCINIFSFKIIKMNFIKELIKFISLRKKFWLIPIIFVMMVLGGLIILAEGTVVAPFIYVLF